MSTFGNRVGLARKGLGMTRANLSSRLGISASSLRDLEVKNSTPGKLQELLPKIANELGKSLSYLVMGQVSASATPVVVEVERIEAACAEIRRQVE